MMNRHALLSLLALLLCYSTSLPAQFEGRDSIMTIINTLAEGIVKYQELETGVWWQVTDQNNRKGNYLESSASSLLCISCVKQ